MIFQLLVPVRRLALDWKLILRQGLDFVLLLLVMGVGVGVWLCLSR